MHDPEFLGPGSTDGQRPILPVPPVVCLRIQVALQGAEKREDLGERPAGIAQSGPLVVVAWGAAQREGRVGRRAAPNQAAPVQVQGPAERARLAAVAPVVRERGRSATGDLRRQAGRVGVVGAGLDQGHRAARILTEPGGEHTPGRPRTHDRDVVCSHQRPPTMIVGSRKDPISTQPIRHHVVLRGSAQGQSSRSIQHIIRGRDRGANAGSRLEAAERRRPGAGQGSDGRAPAGDGYRQYSTPEASTCPSG
jgi:hypothetical protein